MTSTRGDTGAIAPGNAATDAPRHRAAGGRAARIAARTGSHGARQAYITRVLKPVEVLDEEGLATIEANADTILEEVGIEFRGDPAALAMLKAAGADVDGERVRFPRGLCRSIIQASARATAASPASRRMSCATGPCATAWNPARYKAASSTPASL